MITMTVHLRRIRNRPLSPKAANRLCRPKSPSRHRPRFVSRVAREHLLLRLGHVPEGESIVRMSNLRATLTLTRVQPKPVRVNSLRRRHSSKQLLSPTSRGTGAGMENFPGVEPREEGR